MLSSIRGAAAAAVGAGAVRVPSMRLATPPSSGPAPTASIPTLPREVGVIVNISEAGLAAARARSAATVVEPVTAPGSSGEVALVRPRLMNLSTSRSIVSNGPLSGNELVEEGTAVNAKPSMHTTLGDGESPLRRWTDGPLTSQQASRPGAATERMASRAFSANTLSARLQQGDVVLGRRNVAQFMSPQASRPGKEVTDHGERARGASTLTARIGQGEAPLEVTPGRHIVRPDGDGNAA